MENGAGFDHGTEQDVNSACAQHRKEYHNEKTRIWFDVPAVSGYGEVFERGCLMKIAIPQYFSLYNEDMRENLAEKGWTINFTNYDLVAANAGKASECIACGQCEVLCPQHLPIIDALKKVAAHYEH